MRQVIDLTYDAVRTRTATVSGFVLLFLVGTYSYFYLLSIETQSAWLAFLLLVGYMAALVIISVPAFSLNVVEILRVVGARPKRTPLWRWMVFLIFTGGVVAVAFFSVRDALSADAESLGSVTQATMLVFTLLSAIVFLGAMLLTAFTPTENTFAHRRATAYTHHVRELCRNQHRRSAGGAAGDDWARDRPAVPGANPKPPQSRAGAATAASASAATASASTSTSSTSTASVAASKSTRAELNGCFCGSQLSGRAVDAVAHLASLHAYPDDLFFLHPLCVLLERDHVGPQVVVVSASDSGSNSSNNGGDNSDARNDETVRRKQPIDGKAASMTIPPLSIAGRGAGPDSDSDSEDHHTAGGPPPMCGALRRSCGRVAAKVAPGGARGRRVFFYPSLLMTTFSITFVLLALAVGVLGKFARDSEDELAAVTERFDSNVSRLRAVRGFLGVLVKLQPELAAIFAAEDLIASLDQATVLLARTGDWVSSFLLAFKRVFPAGLALGFLVAVLTSVLMLRKFRETIFAVRSGRVRADPDFKEGAFPASKVTVFAGVAFSTALLGFAWCTLLSSLVLLIFVWEEPRAYLFDRDRWAFIVGIAIMFFIKLAINKLVINKILTDSFSVRHPVAWGMLGFVFVLVNFVTGVASAIVRFVITVALSFVYLLRLDTSVFPAGLRGSDAGYSSFVSLALMIERHGNPVALEAARLLITEGKEGRERRARRMPPAAEAGAESVERLPGFDETGDHHHHHHPTAPPLPPLAEGAAKARSVAANRWALAYTLLRNPTLRRHRVAGRAANGSDTSTDAPNAPTSTGGNSHWVM
jgi:MFS family permease